MSQHYSRSLLLYGLRDLRWVDEPLAAPGPAEILVRTRAGSISMGTELPLVRGDQREPVPSYPLMTGYESVAEVLACGAAVSGIAPGDRVVATYGHRSHALLAAARAILVPAAIDDRLALLSILACDAAKGVGKLAAPPGTPVLISGAGTIGLLALFNLRANGFSVVDVVEPQPTRRQLALRLGARHAADPADLAALDKGYAAAIECSRHNAAFALLQQRMWPNGQICVLADGNLEPLLLQPEFHSRELTIVGSSDGIDYPGYARWFWAQLQTAEAPPLHELFEAEVPAEQLAETFLALAKRRAPPLKVLVRYKQAATPINFVFAR